VKSHRRHHSKNIYGKSTLSGWCQDIQGQELGLDLYCACDTEWVSGNRMIRGSESWLPGC